MAPLRRAIVLLQAVFFATISFLAVPGAHAAGFPLNFHPEISGWATQDTGSCGFGQCVSENGNQDPTPFAETVVQIDNVWYFHVIVGDPATGFAMESYNRATGGGLITSSPPIGDIRQPTSTPGSAAFSPDGGGNLTSVIGNFSISHTPTTLSVLHGDLSSANPLGDYRVSGTGGNDPRYTAFRMVMTSPSGDMSLDVSKPFLNKKPQISQTVQDGSMTSVFVTNEQGLNYNQDGTAAPLVNTLTLSDPTIPGAGAADFSMAQAQQSLVTAGRYTFTPGTGYHNDENDPTLGWNSTNSTFDFGTYSYAGDTGFQPLTFDWSTVFDYRQNANACSVSAQANGFVREQSGNFGGSCFNKP